MVSHLCRNGLFRSTCQIDTRGLCRCHHLVQYRLADIVPCGIGGGGIVLSPCEGHHILGAVDSSKRLRVDQFCLYVYGLRTAQAHIDGIAQGLQCGVGDGGTLCLQTAECSGLGLRHIAGASECHLCLYSGSRIGFVGDADADIFVSLFSVTQVHHIPQCGIGFLVVSANPVEEDRRAATAALVLFAHLYIESNRLGGDDTEIERVDCFVYAVDEITSECFLILTGGSQGHCALCIRHIVGALKAHLRLYECVCRTEVVDCECRNEGGIAYVSQSDLVPDGIFCRLFVSVCPIESRCAEAGIVRLFGRHIRQRGTEQDILVGLYADIYRVARHHAKGIPTERFVVLCLCGKRPRNRLQIAIGTFKSNTSLDRSGLVAHILDMEQNIFLVGFCLLYIHSIPHCGIGRLAMLGVPSKVHTRLASLSLVQTAEASREGDRLVGRNADIDILCAQSLQHIRLYGLGCRSVRSELYGAYGYAIGIGNKRHFGFNRSTRCAFVDYRQFGHHPLLAERCQLNLVDIFAGTYIIRCIQEGLDGCATVEDGSSRDVGIHQLRRNLHGLLGIDADIHLVSSQHIQY